MADAVQERVLPSRGGIRFLLIRSALLKRFEAAAAA